jgi:hypothetical protein
MSDERSHQKPGIHEVDGAELAQVDGGADNVNITPLCGTRIPNPWPWSPRLLGHPPGLVQ